MFSARAKSRLSFLLNFRRRLASMQGGTGTNTVPKNVMRKYVQSWNLVVQRELPKGLVGQAGYVGTRATGQMSNVMVLDGRGTVGGRF